MSSFSFRCYVLFSDGGLLCGRDSRCVAALTLTLVCESLWTRNILLWSRSQDRHGLGTCGLLVCASVAVASWAVHPVLSRCALDSRCRLAYAGTRSAWSWSCYVWDCLTTEPCSTGPHYGQLGCVCLAAGSVLMLVGSATLRLVEGEGDSCQA